jgi:CRP-like cAMP-binding protein
VVTQGDPGDAFYVIARGEVEIVAADAVGERRMRTLGEGEYFGELALLGDAPRSATVRTLQPTELLRLGRDDFVALCEAQPEVLAAIESEIERRRANQSELVAAD